MQAMQGHNVEEELENSSSPEPKCFRIYFEFLLNPYGRLCILMWWLIVIIVGVFYGRDLLNQTEFSFSAPSGTAGYTADKEFSKEFSSIHDELTFLLYYHCDKCNLSSKINDAINSPLHNMSSAMNQSMSEYSLSHNNIIKEYQDYYVAKHFETISTKKPLGFDTFIKKAYFDTNYDSMLGLIKYDSTLSATKERSLISWLKNKCSSITSEYGNNIVTLSMTGEAALVKDMSEESKSDVEQKDLITIPIALSVLGLIVRSWRLMLIPIFCVFASLMASFSIMNPIATYFLSTSPFAPSIMVSVTIAMSIDYSLFLLTRFREEIEKKHSTTDSINSGKNIEIAKYAIKQMTRWSGKVVLLSGAILSLTYFCLVAYPMNMLQSVGLGAGIAIVCTIWVNLTLTPSLLLTFPMFFSTFGCTCKSRIENDKSSNTNEQFLHVQESNNDNSKQEHNITNPLDHTRNDEDILNNNIDNFSDFNNQNTDELGLFDRDQTSLCDRCWYKCGVITTLFPWSLIIIIVVYGLISPIGWRVLEIKKQLDDTLIFPRNSQYFKTYNLIETDFSAGALAPFYILIPANNNSDKNNVYNESYINNTGNIMTQLWETLHLNGYNTTIYGISMANDYKTNNWTKIQEYLVYEYATATMVNSMHTSSYFSMTTLFDPFNENAFNFIKLVRDNMDSLCNKYNHTCYLTGGSVDEVDAVNTIFSSFPIVLAIIIAVIFSLMGFFFNSLFVPFRLFITIAVPMSLVYGLSILVYQFGLLKSFHWSAISDTNGLYWLIPVMTVTILVGLALDYDIFLFARIYEYRMITNLSTRDSIIRGVYNTGSIITAAGCIMAIAFSGLLMSNMTSLNQTGFILVVAVLVDTFVIRTMLVPAVLSIAKEINWWPGNSNCCNNVGGFGRRRGTRSIRLDSDGFVGVGGKYNQPLDQTM